MMDDQFTLLLDNAPTDLKGWGLTVAGFGTLGGKGFLLVRQELNRGASSAETAFYLLLKTKGGEATTVALKIPGGAEMDANPGISMKGRRLILSSKVTGTITYDGAGVQLNYGGFAKLAELCPWMRQELAKLVETYRRNTGEYPECELLSQDQRRTTPGCPGCNSNTWSPTPPSRPRLEKLRK